MRRKFLGAQPFEPACEEVLELIGELYAIEADLPCPARLVSPDGTGAPGRARAPARRASKTLRPRGGAHPPVGPGPEGRSRQGLTQGPRPSSTY
ncbi:hypothetical protein [Myxococcus xanthus]|uniref:hypothetical protein n=1 Tax=Myxococcus xanthus TaxID=34 RepID=UPI003AB3BC7F